MTFSEFVKVLYPYCGNKNNQADFVILITDKIMKGKPGRAHQDDTYQNPLRSKDQRTLLSYFSGERNISKSDAGIILSSIDKKKFEQYINKCCTKDAQVLIMEDLGKKENIDEIEEIKDLLDRAGSKVCATLFEKIIHDLATK